MWENWTTKNGDAYNESIKFFLEDNIKIKNRIFTSASPNKKIVNENPKIFGEIFSQRIPRDPKNLPKNHETLRFTQKHEKP